MGKAVIYYILLILISIACIFFFISKNYKFDKEFDTSGTNEISLTGDMPFIEPGGYSSKFAVVTNKDINADAFKNDTYATLLVNRDTKTPIVSFNSLRRIYPASTTKLMTGIVVCDALNEGKISLDQNVTLTHDIVLNEEGAVISDLKAGYTISVRNLLYGLMMRSYNDHAMILAELVGGDIDTFCDMMNKKAQDIGATGCHFKNPHGLHDRDHYITAYDMYLILNEASKYDILNEIDGYKSFSYIYTDAEGNEHTDDIAPTNMFLDGQCSLPSNITIHEWKTGTTEAAGNILTMNYEIEGQHYALFVADGVSPEDLYDKIGILFNMSK